MQSSLKVTLDPVDKAVGCPCLSPERNGDRLPKVVQLQSTAANGIEDGGIVDHTIVDTSLPGPEEQVSVCGCPVGGEGGVRGEA